MDGILHEDHSFRGEDSRLILVCPGAAPLPWPGRQGDFSGVAVDHWGVPPNQLDGNHRHHAKSTVKVHIVKLFTASLMEVCRSSESR